MNNLRMVGFGVNHTFTNYGVVQVSSESIDLYWDGALVVSTRPIVWEKLSSRLQTYFNQRLKEKGLEGYQWEKPNTRIDRLLFKELAVLFWMSDQLLSFESAFKEWLKYTPEDRWWMYQQAKDSQKWQKALSVIGS